MIAVYFSCTAVVIRAAVRDVHFEYARFIRLRCVCTVHTDCRHQTNVRRGKKYCIRGLACRYLCSLPFSRRTCTKRKLFGHCRETPRAMVYYTRKLFWNLCSNTRKCRFVYFEVRVWGKLQRIQIRRFRPRTQPQGFPNVENLCSVPTHTVRLYSLHVIQTYLTT